VNNIFLQFYVLFLFSQHTTVKSVFTESADLSKMSEDKLYLDGVVQQAGVRVCVGGSSSNSLTSTWTAAQQRSIANNRGLPNVVSGSAFTSQRVIKESVVVDRPFAYALYNTVNGIMYVIGKVEQPVWDEEDIVGEDSSIETIKM
jgi:serine protease inhibitor